MTAAQCEDSCSYLVNKTKTTRHHIASVPIVSSENDDGVVEHALFRQRFRHIGDTFVDTREHARERAALWVRN